MLPEVRSRELPNLRTEPKKRSDLRKSLRHFSAKGEGLGSGTNFAERVYNQRLATQRYNRLSDKHRDLAGKEGT